MRLIRVQVRGEIRCKTKSKILRVCSDDAIIEIRGDTLFLWILLLITCSNIGSGFETSMQSLQVHGDCAAAGGESQALQREGRVGLLPPLPSPIAVYTAINECCVYSETGSVSASCFCPW